MKQPTRQGLIALYIVVSTTGAACGGIADGEALYKVTIMITGLHGQVGALQFDVEYMGASGNFVGGGHDVDCRSLIVGGLAAFTNKGNGKVTGAMVSIDGFATPSLIASCTFASEDDVMTTDFTATATDASDIDTDPLPVLPQMAVVEAVPFS